MRQETPDLRQVTPVRPVTPPLCFGALVLCIRGNGIIYRAHKAIQGGTRFAHA